MLHVLRKIIPSTFLKLKSSQKINFYRIIECHCAIAYYFNKIVNNGELVQEIQQ